MVPVGTSSPTARSSAGSLERVPLSSTQRERNAELKICDVNATSGTSGNLSGTQEAIVNRSQAWAQTRHNQQAGRMVAERAHTSETARTRENGHGSDPTKNCLVLTSGPAQKAQHASSTWPTPRIFPLPPHASYNADKCHKPHGANAPR